MKTFKEYINESNSAAVKQIKAIIKSTKFKEFKNSDFTVNDFSYAIMIMFKQDIHDSKKKSDEVEALVDVLSKEINCEKVSLLDSSNDIKPVIEIRMEK